MSTNSICNCSHKCGSLEFRLSNIEEKLSTMLQCKEPTTTTTAENSLSGVENKLNLLETQINFISSWIKTQFGVEVINNVDKPPPPHVNNAGQATNNNNSIHDSGNEVPTTKDSELILQDSLATSEVEAPGDSISQGVLVETKVEDTSNSEEVEIEFDEMYSSTTTATVTTGSLIDFQHEQEPELPESKFVLEGESQNSHLTEHMQVQLPAEIQHHHHTRRRGRVSDLRSKFSPYRRPKNMSKSSTSSKLIPKLGTNKLPAQTAQTRPVCPLCAKSFFDKSGLYKHHLRIHSTQARYTCKLCGASCVNPSELNGHMRFHGAERKKSCKFVCEPCQLFYRRAADLVQHNALRH